MLNIPQMLVRSSGSLANYSCQPIWHSLSAVRVMYCDASDTGYGGYVVEHVMVLVWDCLKMTTETRHACYLHMYVFVDTDTSM